MARSRKMEPARLRQQDLIQAGRLGKLFHSLRAEFDRAGDIVRLYDKEANREVLASGQSANQWQAFEDRPLDWEAWDIDIFYDEKIWLADPEADLGERRFTYSLLPHRGDWRNGTVPAAYCLNNPLIIHDPAFAEAVSTELRSLMEA